jgi:uncharacterized MAPEG superfamily protein
MIQNFYITYVLFAVVAYLIVTDKSVAAAFVLLGKIFRLWFEKAKWWVMYSPDNPVVKYLMWRHSMKLAKELMDEFENK